MKRLFVGTCGNKVGLARYVNLFNALEVNATFYRFPSEKSLRNWEKTLSGRQDFCLSLKAFQGLTHPLSSPTWRRSGLSPEELEGLKGKVGCLRLTEATQRYFLETLELAARVSARYLLLQLPRNCEAEAAELRKFLSWAREVPGPERLHLALEIRWEDPDLLLELWEEFQTVPAFDPLLFPEFLERLRALPRLYFRLHGERQGSRLNYHKKYREEELQKLAELVKELPAEEILVFFNNVYMHEDALRFRKLWG
ncbi:DUF72 domain-containing protein [Thermosulfurimonas marina]|uniref:DUF72 domain-containing protein n=1 Tax=Thermosulfurimonas marina TaxID=2047767 RepID=A0A6H1WRD1_9BACT|nr:DUF72 domain-containing protein [Thermosulfurimonas marina]QJA05777.1 DUF72 domain-containing protein [Thermosulfurimonas marina]